MLAFAEKWYQSLLLEKIGRCPFQQKWAKHLPQPCSKLNAGELELLQKIQAFSAAIWRLVFTVNTAIRSDSGEERDGSHRICSRQAMAGPQAEKLAPP
jgi:hypothetical protein